MVAPSARAAAFRTIQDQLNASGPFYPLIQPGQVVASSKNLTNDAFNALYWIDVAAVGSR
jgi:peptide/nickel transport system substrate-binding protein